MKKRKTAGMLILLALCMALSGCRVRTGEGVRPPENSRESASAAEEQSGGKAPGGGETEEPRETPGTPEDETGGADADSRTRENPEASRKEYDENAPAEIVAGTDRELHGEGEGEGASTLNKEESRRVSRLDGEAEEPATQTVPAEDAERKGTSPEAEEAESALVYYSVLLRERTESLFECKRLNLYWETKENYVTVYKTSPEHALILGAGGYDVSARLLEENLRVDAGWVARKNPGVIVKILDRSALGAGASSLAAARRALQELRTREGWERTDAVRNGRILLLSEELLDGAHLQTAAMLLIARTAYPELFADTDPDQALRRLQEENAGSAPEGIWYYSE